MRVGWQTEKRNNRKVALELHETRAMDSVHALNEAVFFDELFEYIREIGAWPLLEQLDPDDRRGALYPFIQFVLVTLTHEVVEQQLEHAGVDARQHTFGKHGEQRVRCKAFDAYDPMLTDDERVDEQSERRLHRVDSSGG